MATGQRTQHARFNSFDRILMEDYAENTRAMQAELERLQTSLQTKTYESDEDLVRAIQEA